MPPPMRVHESSAELDYVLEARRREPQRSEIESLDEHFEIVVAAIILDGNSQIWFHKGLVTGDVMKINHARGRA